MKKTIRVISPKSGVMFSDLADDEVLAIAMMYEWAAVVGKLFPKSIILWKKKNCINVHIPERDDVIGIYVSEF